MSLESTMDELNAKLGQEILLGDWIEISQERIDMFAECTHDKQWMHTDPVMAQNGPSGTTVAPGFLIASFVPYYFYQVQFKYEGSKYRMNYGIEKVRFITPVPVGSRIRDRIVLSGAEVRPGNRILMSTSHTFEIEGVDDPACIVEISGIIAF